MACSDVDKIISEYKSLTLNSESNKVKCSYTGHEMPCRADAILSYVNGKKYKKAQDMNCCLLLEKYKEHLEPSVKKNRRNQLFCKITWRHLNNDPGHIEKHVNGKRFQRALKHFEKCKETGTPFKPLSGLYGVKRQKDDSDAEKKYSLNPDDSGSDRETDAPSDDMQDLYPDADMSSDDGTDTGDSDFEFENLEEVAGQQEPQDGAPAESGSRSGGGVTSAAEGKSGKRAQRRQKGPPQKQQKVEQSRAKSVTSAKPAKSSLSKGKKLKQTRKR